MRASLPISILVLALLISACCFGDFAQGFQQGFSEEMSLATDCAAVTALVNASVTRITALPEPAAGIAEPTPEQIEAGFGPLASAYEDAANQLAAVPLTNARVRAHRDALAAVYREGAWTLRQQGRDMAAAMRAGDLAAIERAGNAGVELDAREQTVIRDLNATCAAP